MPNWVDVTYRFHGSENDISLFEKTLNEWEEAGSDYKGVWSIWNLIYHAYLYDGYSPKDADAQIEDNHKWPLRTKIDEITRIDATTLGIDGKDANEPQPYVWDFLIDVLELDLHYSFKVYEPYEYGKAYFDPKHEDWTEQRYQSWDELDDYWKGAYGDVARHIQKQKGDDAMTVKDQKNYAIIKAMNLLGLYYDPYYSVDGALAFTFGDRNFPVRFDNWVEAERWLQTQVEIEIDPVIDQQISNLLSLEQSQTILVVAYCPDEYYTAERDDNLAVLEVEKDFLKSWLDIPTDEKLQEWYVSQYTADDTVGLFEAAKEANALLSVESYISHDVFYAAPLESESIKMDSKGVSLAERLADFQLEFDFYNVKDALDVDYNEDLVAATISENERMLENEEDRQGIVDYLQGFVDDQIDFEIVERAEGLIEEVEELCRDQDFDNR